MRIRNEQLVSMNIVHTPNTNGHSLDLFPSMIVFWVCYQWRMERSQKCPCLDLNLQMPDHKIFFWVQTQISVFVWSDVISLIGAFCSWTHMPSLAHWPPFWYYQVFVKPCWITQEGLQTSMLHWSLFKQWELANLGLIKQEEKGKEIFT